MSIATANITLSRFDRFKQFLNNNKNTISISVGLISAITEIAFIILAGSKVNGFNWLDKAIQSDGWSIAVFSITLGSPFALGFGIRATLEKIEKKEKN